MNKLLYIGLAFFVFACGQPKQEEQTLDQTIIEEKTVLKIDSSSVRVFWTAFKHTAKVGVNGGFDSLKVLNLKEGELIEDVLEGIGFEIYTQSVNSKDGARDAKIREFYFGKMINTDKIKGTILSAENGTANLVLTINDTKIETEATYEVKGNELSLRTTLNMEDFNAQESIKELNKVCEERHTGDDGKSVFWPDVDVLVTAIIQ